MSLSSQLVRELIIDFLSNLSFITYAMCFLLLTTPSDNSLRLLSFHNSIWVTICLAIIVIYKIPPEETPSTTIMIKNVVILGFCSINIAFHYFAGLKIFSMPVILIGLYIINLLINAN